MTNDQRAPYLRAVAPKPAAPDVALQPATDGRGNTIAVSLVEGKPMYLRNDWWKAFFDAFELSGNFRDSCRIVGIDRQVFDRTHTRSGEFRQRWAEVNKSLTEQLFAVGFGLAKAGNVAMLQSYQRALDPRFADKRTVEHVITQKERKEIEKRALAAGVDPEKVLRRIDEARAKRGIVKQAN